MKRNRTLVVVASVVLITSLLVIPAAALGFRWDSFTSVWRAIFRLRQDVRELQNQAKPDFDSGWVFADMGIEDITLVHNLGTRDLMAYIYYRMEDPGIPSADFKQTHNIRASEVYWEAYDYNEINIRFPYSDYAWQEIRVLIWVIPN